MVTATGSAEWTGGVKDGRGSVSARSGALSGYPFGFASRFEGKLGSNPEELLGAAHAACFTMALALLLTEAGLRADNLKTTAAVTLGKDGQGVAITGIHLTLRGQVPGATPEVLAAHAQQAKEQCPVSKVLTVPVTLDVSLDG